MLFRSIVSPSLYWGIWTHTDHLVSTPAGLTNTSSSSNLVIPGGIPSRYWPGSTLLSFSGLGLQGDMAAKKYQVSQNIIIFPMINNNNKTFAKYKSSSSLKYVNLWTQYLVYTLNTPLAQIPASVMCGMEAISLWHCRGTIEPSARLYCWIDHFSSFPWKYCSYPWKYCSYPWCPDIFKLFWKEEEMLHHGKHASQLFWDL